MASSTPRVQPGSFLTLHYRLAGPFGDIINTFEGKPSTMPLGSGALSPALEERLIGLEEGVRTRFDIPAGEAFGDLTRVWRRLRVARLTAQNHGQRGPSAGVIVRRRDP